ncbi:hypothetical protein PV04_07867 [Phialophora macrospora]|uniref:Zn(2)-C6 fungal-type domain-containing protein n=1 Tax=Phialophora macrospora TaxID=1851006 RepID=A0A0D2FFQ2_9EURO|nr:hypothetical protein PV04_07867 [Phialophora macrospora]
MTIRPHTKRRTGCLRCKERRVKCDEQKPDCSNCRHRSSRCQYPALRTHVDTDSDQCDKTRQGKHQGSTSPSPESILSKPTQRRSLQNPAGGADHVVSWVSAADRSRELHLIYFWCTRTCHSFTSKHANVFRDHAMEQAKTHSYVMDAILALTAAQVASETPPSEERNSQVHAALQYHTNAISELHAEMDSCAQSGADTIFVASILTMACAVVLPFLQSPSTGDSTPATEVLLHIHGFMKGLGSIVDLSAQSLREGACRQLFGESSIAEDLVMSTEDMLSLQRLQDLNEAHRIEDEQLWTTYKNAITELRLGFSFNRLRAMRWVISVGRAFVDQVQKGEPLALLISLHWAVLLCRLHEMWWAQYVGQHLLAELSHHPAVQGSSSRDILQWAMSHIQPTQM